MSGAAKFLAEVRALVAQGWTQRKLLDRRDDVQCYCLVGAIQTVTFKRNGPSAYALRRTACNALRNAAGDLYLARWNDAEGRTQADVLALIDRTIEAVQ